MDNEQVNTRLQQGYIDMCQAIKEDNKLSIIRRFIRANCDYMVWLILMFLIVLQGAYADNMSGHSGYLWYDTFDTITSWDFNTNTVGDQSGAPEFEVASFDGDNRLRDKLDGASGIELEDADLGFTNNPLCMKFEHYSTNVGTYDYLQSKGADWRFQMYYRAGVAADDIRVSEYTSGTHHTYGQADIVNAQWNNITICLANSYSVFYLGDIVKLNVTNNGVMDQSLIDNDLNFRGDGIDSYYDNFKIWYGRYQDEPIPVGGDSTPPVISNVNCTSPDPDDTTEPYETTDTTPTMVLNTDEAATCAISQTNDTYVNCATTGATSHVCTLGSALNLGTDYIYVNCTDGSTNSKTDQWTMNIINSCNYSGSGDWVITDHCQQISSIDICPNDINITATGYLNVSGASTIINASRVRWVPSDAGESFRLRWYSPAKVRWGSC